ncbi:MAG: nucleotide exchange factor GrpE [Candidatus Aenigmarchaeota archaeon]|nr:nucleotide exchange factor GrpE [Candidatus Aenigmarchaeota archaeon]
MKKELEEKTSKLEIELQEKAKLAEEYSNRLKYLQADFDNYRKKFDKEKDDIRRLANEDLIKEFLPIIDEFEIALNEIENGRDKIGLGLLYKKLLKTLENHGLKHIDALGKKFDPNFHEILLKEMSDKEDGIILEELQKGYLLKSKVIRPSKVKIAENIKN